MIEPDGGRDPVEVLAERFCAEHREGLAPTIEQYQARHPEHAGRIEALFPALLMMEGLKQQRTAPPRRFGDFAIVREIGRGGMGVVYEALQQSLDRRVALKLLPESATLAPGQLERFGREAQAAARLHHTNIVPVFGVGRAERMHYYVMQYIEGQGLDQAPRPDPAWRWAARIGAQAARALEYAHGQGVLHRDVKPANLLLDAAGTVWVADFGLAKLAEQDDLTRSGDVVGTLRYMAPEQLEGRADARSDVYGLGLVLYELVAGRPAFDESDRGRLIAQVSQTEPPRPGRLAPAIPRDLETIVLKCIARDPAHRYAGAGELAGDLELFLDDRPIRARRAGEFERLWRWCRRNRAVAALSGTALLLLVAVALAASIGYVQTQAALSSASQQARKARQSQVRADAARARAQQQSTAARAERRRAEANLRVALAAFAQISDRVARRAGRRAEGAADEQTEPRVRPAPSREMAAILVELLQFYDQFALVNSDDPALQREMARAHHRAGDIHQRLGQYARAEPAYRRALAIYARTGPSLKRAVLHNELGLVLQAVGRHDDARAAHDAARALLLGRPPRTPATAAERYELARCDKLIGDLLRNRGTGPDAAPHYLAAMVLLERLVRAAPRDPDYRHLLALTYRNLPGMIYRAALLLRDREEPGRHAMRILEQLAREFPDVPDYRLDLAETYMMLIDGIGRRFTSADQAEQQLQKALALGRQLTHDHPGVPEYQASLVRCYRKLGEAQERRGRREEAEMTYRLALAGQRQLVAASPDVPLYRLYLAATRHALGRLLARGDAGSPEARTLIEHAIIDQLKYLQTSPRSRYGRHELARQYESLERVLRRQGREELARQAHEHASEVRRTLHGPPLVRRRR